MRNLIQKNKWLLLLLVLVLTACGSDNDNSQPVTQPATGANNQLLAIFPVDQLGDQGYADNVMSAVTNLMELNSQIGKDTLDVMFFQPVEDKEMIPEIKRWLKKGVNLFYGEPYKRRLLLLTDSYMLDWIPDFLDDLQPTDEILVLRAIDEDVAPIAAALGLEGRLHAINISVAGSVRKFREYVDSAQVVYKDEKSELKANFVQIPVFRIYPDSIYHYRDSLVEALTEVLPETELVSQTYMATVGDALWSEEYEKPLIQVAYDMADEMMKYYKNPSTHWSCAVVDFGSANGGWDFFLLNTYGRHYVTLMLDAQPSSFLDRMAITRHFGRAVEEWVMRWMAKPVGEMPVFEGHGHWDEYCTDNIEFYIDMLEQYRYLDNDDNDDEMLFNE